MSKIYLFHSKLLFVLYYTSNIAVNDAMVINQCKYYRRHLYHIWNKADCILINVYAIFYQLLPSLVCFFCMITINICTITLYFCPKIFIALLCIKLSVILQKNLAQNKLLIWHAVVLLLTWGRICTSIFSCLEFSCNGCKEAAV